MKIESMTIHSVLGLLLLSACGCDTEPPRDEATAGATAATTAGPGGEPTGGATPAELPAELRGVWLDHWSTSMGYELAAEAYDFDTNVWFKGLPDLWDMAPYRGFGISFDQDGNFTWLLGADGGLGGCQSYSLDFMKGTATVVNDTTIQFHAVHRRQRYESTCDPSLNYDQDASGGVFEMDFALGATQDTGLPTLRIVNKTDGTAFDYFKH